MKIMEAHNNWEIKNNKEEEKMKTTKKAAYVKLTVMMVVFFVMGAQVFAGTFTANSITATKHPFSSIRLLSLYNNTGHTVYDVSIKKLLYVDFNGFFHWEPIKEIDKIEFLSTVTVTVPANAGLLVDYCVGEDGCSYYDRESTGSFGPLRNFRTTVTLY